MQLGRRGRTYHACVSHVACNNGKLYLSSRSWFCSLAVWMDWDGCKERLTRVGLWNSSGVAGSIKMDV
jgi:hypothetical protein